MNTQPKPKGVIHTMNTNSVKQIVIALHTESSHNHRKTESTSESTLPRCKAKQLTCERCGNKTDAGVWLGFVYVGIECLTKDDQDDLESPIDKLVVQSARNLNRF